MAFEDGPYVQAACFCENVIEDKTGTLSLIRIIDKQTRTVHGSNPPIDMPPSTLSMKFVLMLKSGNARGRGDIEIKIEPPSGIKENGLAFSVRFEGEDKGHNLVADMNVEFTQEGVYWFWVYLDEQVLTSVPFLMQYVRIVTQQ